MRVGDEIAFPHASRLLHQAVGPLHSESLPRLRRALNEPGEAPLPADTGLTLETLLMAGPALIGMILLDMQGQGGFFRHGAQTDILLLLSGPITAVPLLMFAGAAKTIPLSMLGVLQYIAPTLQFLIGVLILSEPMPSSRWIGFVLVWSALIVFTADSWRRYRRSLPAVADPGGAAGAPEGAEPI